MTGAMAFLRKEFHEILRTYKIYVIPAIFLLMGFFSPLVAKFTPEIVKSMAPKMQGFSFTLPPPSAVDAYAQLLKNYNQIDLLVLIFSMMGLVVEEKVRGTAALLLVKPVSRRSFIVDKYLASAVLVAVAVMLLAVNPLANFIHNNPTVVMLALGFLIMIGMILIADGFGAHIPRGYIYTAMAFSIGVEALNMLSRRAERRRKSMYAKGVANGGNNEAPG